MDKKELGNAVCVGILKAVGVVIAVVVSLWLAVSFYTWLTWL